MQIPEQENLIGLIADWDNLEHAYRKARRGKRAREEVETFAANLFDELARLQCEIITGTYRMGAYRRFVVYEPKRREILAAPFRDRVLQHAILNIVEARWDKAMIDDTYACRTGKGTHIGADRIQRWLRDMSKQRPLADVWVAKTDFSKYFASLRHADLKRVARRRITCPGTLALLDEIIDSTPGDVGIPVGNLTSQWLANLLGNELDQWIKRELRVKRYLRYMDDTVALFASKIEAQLYLDKLERRAAGFGLRFSKRSLQRASFGVNMLGYRIWPAHRLLRKRSIVKFRRDIKQMRARIKTGASTRDALLARVLAWDAHARRADTHRLRAKLYVDL
ncbi:reverse transcriptase domain-containing protein [Crenobacter caeni]|uniref:RNA-directed DNA polymerase n=1 Tax=Crenobacter caeni TaxID=2705474 RepID=A0A6B2KNY3_9NEIS|nr:reverse transcriptase domain-containing protein [Crenobacter caeni]NDV11689.1 RNA-directed DNA polymerase [Crenobacter caeni]